MEEIDRFVLALTEVIVLVPGRMEVSEVKE